MNEATEVPSGSESEEDEDEEIDEVEGSKDSDQEEAEDEDKEEAVDEGGGEYTVQEILDHQELKTVGTKYLVWWTGHPRADVTWEPAENLTGKKP